MLTSLANERVKRVVKLRTRRHRDREGRFIVEGARALRAALRAGFPLETVFYCESHCVGADTRELLDGLIAAGSLPESVSSGVLAKLSYRDNAGGLLAVACIPDTGLDALTAPSGASAADAMWLVAAGVEKPGNLGAMLRTADAAGAAGAIVADPTTDPFNPNVVRASVGTLFSVPLAVASAEAVRGWLSTHSIRIVTTSPDAPTDYAAADLRGAVAIVVGGEHGGLDGDWLGVGEAVRIPMAGQADSLNAATAAAVLLFEARRQRTARGS